MDNNAESQQSAENKSAPKSDEDEQQLVAGRKPAVKVGGMRVVQHKSQTSSTEEKHLEDVTGLAAEPPNPKSTSGVQDIGNAAFTTDAVRNAHKVNQPSKNDARQPHVKPHNPINQPR